MLADLRALNSVQRKTVLASFLGWTLDSFDYFVLVYAVKAIAQDFHVAREEVAFAITLTLAARPFGAYVFGRLADAFGRRPILMLDILLFSAFELASAFAPSLTVLLILRTLFGFAMGGEWGLGASLTMETIPEQSRGVVSGLLQEGYALGSLLAAAMFGLFFDSIGWRGMFIVGCIPALLVIYIRMHVPESPVWEQMRRKPPVERAGLAAMRGMWGRAFYMILLMTAFTFFSHGTQDLYPTFLQVEHQFDNALTSQLGQIGQVGAILGGLTIGALSQRIGRKRAIILAALLAFPVLKLWAFSDGALWLAVGAFAMQFSVQGSWGVIPVHLNELSPDAVRGTLPGLTYQIGNFISSIVPWLLALLAERNGKQYGLTMAVFIGAVVIVLIAVTAFGPEAKDRRFGEQAAVK